MATGAQGWIHCALEGCIPAFDSEIRQRPYHRNCSCALHGSRFRSCHLHCKAKISYPIQHSLERLHLTISASSFPNSSCCIKTSFSCHELKIH
ncbi:hypothetical protein COCNU_11G011860 [Cocos nucifera]|uniref:Uncharacterized protein n=1 Tax=Cocos nucifera TaxID=13894 RepID=A0A8K0IQ86_COCNU|nr:hypothetical protein COCNU_11G011860 [Cocos nucifera]